MHLPASIVDAATAILQRESVVCAAFLHGSAAKGTSRPGSDIDIAVILWPKATLAVDDRLELATRLSLAVGRQVDLGVISPANLVYAKEVIEHGIRLFSKDPAHSDGTVAHCLALYADLQQSRKEVLRAYAA